MLFTELLDNASELSSSVDFESTNVSFVQSPGKIKLINSQ